MVYSDQRSRYKSKGGTEFVEGIGIIQSVSRVNSHYDNDPIELIDMDRIQ